MALLLVVAVLAVAAALGWVMLSGTVLQNRAGANQLRLSTADYLAESGLNLALYYLQHSDRAPSLNASGYWGGTGGDIAIASGVAGTVNVTVTQDATDPWSYEIVSVAKAGNYADTKITKTTGARVYVRNEYQITKAAAFNNDVKVMNYMTVIGDVWSSKQLSINTAFPAGSIQGVGYCKTPAGTGLPTGGFKGVPAAGWPGPSGTNDLNMYSTYSISDVTYSCDTTAATSLSSITFNPTASNPAGVIYKDASSGALTLGANTVINGTLVVKGNLTINGPGIVITAQPNFPALIVTGTLTLNQSNNSLTVNGVCYVGNTIKSSGSAPPLPANSTTFAVNGALLGGTTGGASVNTLSYNVYATVKYDATKAKVPDMTSVQRVAKGVSIVRWGLP